MYQAGDSVVYGMHGVCDVTDLEEKVIDGKRISYLVLEPVGHPGSRYLVPAHNPAAVGKLRKMLSQAELQALLQSENIRQDCWIRDENLRKQTYRELIAGGDPEKLTAMVYTLYQHKKQQAALGRKVHLCDDNFLRDAEKLLTGEVSVVMELEPEQARQYIRSSLMA